MAKWALGGSWSVIACGRYLGNIDQNDKFKSPLERIKDVGKYTLVAFYFLRIVIVVAVGWLFTGWCRMRIVQIDFRYHPAKCRL